MAIQLRRATLGDAETIAAVFSPSFRLLTFLPALHTLAEDRWFIEHIVLRDCEVLLAERDSIAVAFLARQGDEVRLLYVHPDNLRSGAGTQLLAAAKAGRDILELWCFQANTPARRFYERHGFRAVRFTDGARNEEKMPDVRYRWERHA
jgi:GNAT superfamily N-acetyltransferase